MKLILPDFSDLCNLIDLEMKAITRYIETSFSPEMAKCTVKPLLKVLESEI